MTKDEERAGELFLATRGCARSDEAVALILAYAKGIRREFWILSADRLPETCCPVIAFGMNCCGKGRTIRAAYTRKNELEASGEYDGWGEYDEATDTYYAPEGWYEWNEHENTHWQVDFEITHWMPLPEPPPKIRQRLRHLRRLIRWRRAATF